jgi:hypothetical protein
MTISKADFSSVPGGKARSYEAGAGTVGRPMAANAGSTPAPLVSHEPGCPALEPACANCNCDGKGFA